MVVGEEVEPRNINCVFLAVEHDWMLGQSCGPRASLEADAITPHLRPARSRVCFRFLYLRATHDNIGGTTCRFASSDTT